MITAGCLVMSFAGCDNVSSPTDIFAGGDYSMDKTLSDGAQRNTIAFDGLAFLTGNLGAQSSLPPGKVADFAGFQYLRDNDPTNMGHSTNFLTIIAFNVMHILTSDQINLMIERARTHVPQINEYAYKRFPLMDAFRRILEGNIPAGTTGLDKDAVMRYSAELYRLDGQISYARMQLFGSILRSLTTQQQAAFEELKTLNGIGHWNGSLSDPLQNLHLEHDVHVAVMTYASEMYSWYAGSVEADTYFCPERQGTYFGSFYLKASSTTGDPDYPIDEQLTARAGEDFLRVLTDSQAELVEDLVDIQRSDLHGIVAKRQAIATQLRRFMTEESVDSALVLALSEQYGEHDGAIVYYYATHFAQISQSLSNAQRTELKALVSAIGYYHPAGAFLYSQPIAMPTAISIVHPGILDTFCVIENLLTLSFVYSAQLPDSSISIQIR